MAKKESRIIVRRQDAVTIISFVDRNILEESAIQQIADEIIAIIGQSINPKILISFENVEHLSSAALGSLITVNNRVREKSGQLRLARIDPQIYEVFVITKLNKIFQIHDDIEKAIATFR